MPIILETGALANVTAYDLIRRAYRILGDIGVGEALTQDQSDVGLTALNDMLDSFSVDSLNIYEHRQDALSWPSNTTSQTIGSGGDFDIHRPDRIEIGTYFQDANSIAYTPEITRNREVYDSIEDKTVQSSYPELLFYNPSTTLATIYVYPVPNQALTLYLNQYQPLQIFDNLSEVHTLPSGYRRMIAFNLAKELEAEVGLPLPMRASQIADQSLKAVRRNNSLPVYSRTETVYVIHGQGKSDIVAGK